MGTPRGREIVTGESPDSSVEVLGNAEDDGGDDSPKKQYLKYVLKSAENTVTEAAELLRDENSLFQSPILEERSSVRGEGSSFRDERPSVRDARASLKVESYRSSNQS